MSSLNFYCCFEIITIIALSGALQMLCSVFFKGKPKSNFNKMSIFYFLKKYAAKEKYTLPEESFLCLLDFDIWYSRKTLHELSNVFVEHLLHVGIIKSFDPRPNSHVPDTVGSVLTIGL